MKNQDITIKWKNTREGKYFQELTEHFYQAIQKNNKTYSTKDVDEIYSEGLNLIYGSLEEVFKNKDETLIAKVWVFDYIIKYLDQLNIFQVISYLGNLRFFLKFTAASIVKTDEKNKEMTKKQLKKVKYQIKKMMHQFKDNVKYTKEAIIVEDRLYLPMNLFDDYKDAITSVAKFVFDKMNKNIQEIKINDEKYIRTRERDIQNGYKVLTNHLSLAMDKVKITTDLMGHVETFSQLRNDGPEQLQRLEELTKEITDRLQALDSNEEFVKAIELANFVLSNEKVDKLTNEGLFKGKQGGVIVRAIVSHDRDDFVKKDIEGVLKSPKLVSLTPEDIDGKVKEAPIEFKVDAIDQTYVNIQKHNQGDKEGFIIHTYNASINEAEFQHIVFFLYKVGDEYHQMILSNNTYDLEEIGDDIKIFELLDYYQSKEESVHLMLNADNAVISANLTNHKEHKK